MYNTPLLLFAGNLVEDRLMVARNMNALRCVNDAQGLHPGDVVNILPEVKNWHGASKDSTFSHLAVEVPAEGSSNEWLEAVTDEVYGKLK